jgi:Na+/H+ antiporter NhaC
MNDHTTSNDAWQTFRSVYWTLAAAMVIVLLLLAVLGFGPGGRNCKPAATVAATTAAEDAAVATHRPVTPSCGPA